MYNSAVQGKSKGLSKRTKAIIGGTIGILLVVAVWWIVSASLENAKNYVLPSPYAVLLSLLEALFGAAAGKTYAAIGFTLARSLGGFLSAFLIAFLLGSIGHEWPFFDSIVAPWNKLAKVFPTAAVSLILIVVFSRDATMMNLVPAILSFLVAEPILYEGFRNGLRNGPSPDEREALSLDAGTHSFQGLFQVELPAATGYILTAVAASLGLSIKVTIMSEVLTNFSNVNPGIGSLIVLAQQYAAMDDLIAYSLLSVIVSAFFDAAAFLIGKAASKLESGNGRAESSDKKGGGAARRD